MATGNGSVPPSSGGPSKPLVFVSYSHKDEAWKEKLLPHLRHFELGDLLEVWEDRKFEPGAEWYANIRDVMNRTRCALCLISADFLASRFCQFEEIPYLLQQRRKRNLEIVPVLLRSCDWSEQRWLKRLQMLPRDGKSVAKFPAKDRDDIYMEIASAARKAIEPDHVPYRPPAAGTPPEKVDIDRLPETGALLFGRREELKFLDQAWAERKLNVVVFRASGGVGKSTLVRCWVEELAEDNYPGAERVFAWSFFSQGAGDTAGKQGRVTSADQFISEALHFFGDETRGAGLSAWDRGQKLADLIPVKRTLLLLDGMEPLQSIHAAVQRGEITDPGLATLVEELARHNPGLCIISTREKITNLADPELKDRVKEVELDFVTPLAGRALLRERGAEGKDDQLEATVKTFGGHAYALQLLGRYLEFFGGSEIAAVREFPAGAEYPEESRHPRRVMAAFAGKFGAGSAEVELLRVLGLFDRPAEGNAIAAVRAEPIPGLTELLATLDDGAWRGLLDRLRATGLVAPPSSHAPDELDAHPLVREHFGAELRARHPDAWRVGHARLYEYFKALPEKHQPDTLEEMAPLFQAVFHGCQAEKYYEAYHEVYRARIRRQNEHYVLKKLGAFGADLSAINGFFEGSWESPVQQLEKSRGWLLNAAGFRLRALGRLREAVAPMRSAADWAVANEDWPNATTSFYNLSEVQLTLGEVAEAITLAEQGIDHADRSGDWQSRIVVGTTLADALHQAGDGARAEALFQEAEQLQAKRQPGYPWLYSLQGYEYCDLLLDRGRYPDVRDRAAQTLDWGKMGGLGLLTIALDHLSLGRAELLANEIDGSGDLAKSEKRLNEAVDGLRRAGTIHNLPWGLLARAAYFRITKQFDFARRDLDEAMRIAIRSGMRLHECDAHLEYARLELAQRNRDAARGHFRDAEKLVAATGYHRRDGELDELKAALG